MLLAACGDSNDTGAQGDGEIDYSGQTITFVLPTSPGGGMDAKSQLVARHLGKYLPGNPNIAIDYVEGGQGTIGMNAFENTEKDGLSLAVTSSGILLNQLLGSAGVAHDWTTWTPVATDCGSSGVMLRTSSGYTGNGATVLDDVTGRVNYPIYDHLTAAGVHLFFMDVLGMDVNAVLGYEGTGPMLVALEQGEVQAVAGGVDQMRDSLGHLITSGDAHVLVTAPQFVDGEPQRNEVFPDAPHWFELYEMVHGEELTGPEYETLRSLSSLMFEAQTSFWFHGDVPDELVEPFRVAFAEMSEDAEFISDAVGILCGETMIVGEDVSLAASHQQRAGDTVAMWFDRLVDYGWVDTRS